MGIWRQIVRITTKAIGKLKVFLAYQYHGAFFRQPKAFLFQGKIYHYLYHRYGEAWNSERTVEVPIVQEVVQQYHGRKVLEVGNVLSHYFPVCHTVLDKYEKVPGVINEDVVDFRPPDSYDLIVSISTLEHVGYDESPRDDSKFWRAIENLKRLLARDGVMIITLPIGYNRNVDDLLKEKRELFTRISYLKRISRNNEWMEVSWDEIKDVKFEFPFPYANGVAVCVFERRKMAHNEP